MKRFRQITMTAFDTLETPRVGVDPAATEWALKQGFPNRKDKSVTEEAFLEQMHGFRVLDLVAPCDGLPRFTNSRPRGYVERYSFRAQFLRDCTEIIGDNLLEEAYLSKLPGETVAFGEALAKAGLEFASTRGIDIDSTRAAENPDTVEFRVAVVLAAGRWCHFWGQRGHWLEVYS